MTCYVNATINVPEGEYNMETFKAESLEQITKCILAQYPDATSLVLSIVFDRKAIGEALQ